MPTRDVPLNASRDVGSMTSGNASDFPAALGAALGILDPIERRVAPRHVPLEFRAWIGWWDGDDFVATGVRLVDISRAGAAVEAGEPIPVGQDVWFCFAQGRDREAVA